MLKILFYVGLPLALLSVAFLLSRYLALRLLIFTGLQIAATFVLFWLVKPVDWGGLSLIFMQAILLVCGWIACVAGHFLLNGLKERREGKPARYWRVWAVIAIAIAAAAAFDLHDRKLQRDSRAQVQRHNQAFTVDPGATLEDAEKRCRELLFDASSRVGDCIARTAAHLLERQDSVDGCENMARAAASIRTDPPVELNQVAMARAWCLRKTGLAEAPLERRKAICATFPSGLNQENCWFAAGMHLEAKDARDCDSFFSGNNLEFCRSYARARHLPPAQAAGMAATAHCHPYDAEKRRACVIGTAAALKRPELCQQELQSKFLIRGCEKSARTGYFEP